MLLSEAKQILKKNGYRLVEDTDTLEHEIEVQNAEYTKQYNVDGNAWKAGNKINDLNKKAREGSLKAKIDNAKKFNGVTEEDPMLSNTPEGVVALLKSMGIKIDKDDVDIYDDNNTAYITPDLGKGKWKNNLCFIDCQITFTDLKRGKMDIDLDIRKTGLNNSKVSIPVDTISKRLSSVSEIKQSILKYISYVVAAGFKTDPNDYYVRKGELETWQKLVKKFKLA